MQFETIETPALPRLWLLNEESTELIQVQNDRFIKNWRKVGEKDQYPHYEPVIKPAFQRDFAEFQSFLNEENLGAIKVNQCEVTYVNHIVSGEGWQTLGEIHRIFTFWNQPTAPLPGNAEDFGMRFCECGAIHRGYDDAVTPKHVFVIVKEIQHVSGHVD